MLSYLLLLHLYYKSTTTKKLTNFPVSIEIKLFPFNVLELENYTKPTSSYMGSLFSFSLMIIFLSFSSIKIQSQEIKSAHLDLLIRDYTFKSYDLPFRTGIFHTVNLPSNFSGIKVDTARFRCGSLRRYGAQVKEFHLGIGVIVQPCVERVMVIRQNLGHNWSSIYYGNYDLSGYKLVSPILGLLAYNGGSDVNFSNPFELGLHAAKKPITVNFTDTVRNPSKIRPLCASFENNGKVKLKNPESNHVCAAKRHGHYGLVIKSPPRPPPPPEQVKKKISLWKVVVGSTVGSTLGVFLLGLLLVAMFVKVKKKARMEEMERRAYEEEALQVSMVGHVRAPTAAVTRTLPTIEHESKHGPRNIEKRRRYFWKLLSCQWQSQSSCMETETCRG